MVDIHSHILPEVDDGAQSWEMAEHMCQMAAQDGIEHMVATPHANGEFAYDRKWLRGLLELRLRVVIALALLVGAKVINIAAPEPMVMEQKWHGWGVF